ncbi:hypothetical protein AB0I93_07975 [Streptomyces sp. NPDC049967]|uniref:hypothetical protein n=1 Tax=Streptomyces sp. NPDC049967 TaxID=3155658 RepID=UPI00343FD62E
MTSNNAGFTAVPPRALGLQPGRVVAGGALVAAGLDDHEQVSGILKAAEGKKIKAVAGYDATVLAVTEDGTLLAAGSKAAEIMRDCEGKTVRAAGAGSGFAVVVGEDGTLSGAGRENGGQMAAIVKAAEGRKISIAECGSAYFLAVTEEGTLLTSSPIETSFSAQLVKAAEGKKIRDVSAGVVAALAVTEDGTLLAAGSDADQQVSGILKASEGKTITAVAIANKVCLAVTEDGTLLGAGADSQVLGILEATAGRRVTAVVSGPVHVLAVVQERDQDCGPLQPRQVCASLHTAGDQQDAYALVFKVGDSQQQLTSGESCKAVDTQSTQATHILVRRLSPSQDLATGSAYFTYDLGTGAVGIDADKSQLPAGLTYSTSDGNRFTFTWTV